MGRNKTKPSQRLLLRRPAFLFSYIISQNNFPLVCLTHNPFKYKLNAEVEKVLEIPLSFFFESSNYAWLHVTTPEGENAYGEQSRFPCLVISDNDGNDDVLWGATLHIITNFLTVVSSGQLPTNIAGKKLKKIITKNYLSGSR